MRKISYFIKNHIFISSLLFTILFFIINFALYNSMFKQYRNSNNKDNSPKDFFSSDANYYWLNKNIAYRIDVVDSAMGYNTIKIYKTKNAGQNWQSQLANNNGIIAVHYNSTFLFISENLAYIYNPSKTNTETDYGKLMVSTNDSKNYVNCIIEHPKTIKEKNLIISGLPINKNNELVLYVYTINETKTQEKIYYEYTTKNGITWNYNRRIELPEWSLNQ